MKKEKRRARVVALLGNNIQHRNTLATLIKNNVFIVGVCYVNQKNFNLPIKYILKSFKRRGIKKTLSQIFARILYLLRNRDLDNKLKKIIFNDYDNQNIIKESKIKSVNTVKYADNYDFIKVLKPEILVVHTGAWVEKKVREIDSVKYVIGGHPGITPFYRGSHSPFWAIYNNDFKRIGWTCFLLDNGVDTGPIIEQGFLKILNEETFMTLSWRGMVEISKSQVKAITEYENKGFIKIKINKEIPQKSEFHNPTLSELIFFWKYQKVVR